MIEIGEKNGYSAMSLTVSAPTAIGAELILDGKIKERGVLRPIYKDIYEPCLKKLEKMGIRLVEEEEEIWSISMVTYNLLTLIIIIYEFIFANFHYWNLK